MRTIAVIPKQKDSIHMREINLPKINADGVLVRVLQIGVDGTDNEINEGLYGEPPEGEDFLVIGHESFGIVEQVGDNAVNFKPGDLVVATVRRPCGKCINCQNGESDMCLTGDYREIGIKGLHGVMREFYSEVPEFLIKVPAVYKNIGVLLEPLSIVEKAIFQSFKIQERMRWNPKNALVLGAGSIGLLATMILRMKELNTYTLATRPKYSLKTKLVEETGAHYINVDEEPIASLPNKIGNIDIIIEATGSSEVAFEAMNILGINGVLCLTSITGGNAKKEIYSDELNINLVLGNKVIFGTVNANRSYFEMGIKHFGEFENRWPGLLERMITKKLPFEAFKEAMTRDREDIKTVLEIR